MATTTTVKFGDETRKLAASPMTIIYYAEEFERLDADFLADLTFMLPRMIDGFANGIKLMRIVWALEKTYKKGSFESFNTWSKMLANVDFLDPEMLREVAELCTKEFFRTATDENKPEPTGTTNTEE